MRCKINKVVVDSLKEQNNQLKEKINLLEQNIEKKFCPYCKEWKPITDFNKNRSKKDGLQSCCRVCHKKMTSRQPKREEHKFTPSRKEFYGWFVVVTERFIAYEIHGTNYAIIDSFRYAVLCDKFWKELVDQKITQMIKYYNKNNLWKQNEDLYYKLKARCQKECILQSEKQQLNLFNE